MPPPRATSSGPARQAEARGQDDEQRGRASICCWRPATISTAFKNREPDASESPWLYLLFILILVIEQALAVHLSFHMKPGEQGTAAPARPQPAAA